MIPHHPFFFWIHRDCACGGLVCLFRLSVCCFFCSFRSCFTMLAFSCELIPRSVVHHSCLLIVITDSCSPTDLASAHSASTPHTSPQPNPLANPSPPPVRRKHGRKQGKVSSIRPVTLKQLESVSQPHPDADFSLNGVDIALVSTLSSMIVVRSLFVVGQFVLVAVVLCMK